MTRESVASLVLKLLGVYLIAVYLPIAGSYFTVGSWRGELFFFQVLSLIFMICPGILLIRFSTALARRLSPSEEDSMVESTISASDWQSIAFSVLGVLLFARGLPKIVQSLAFVYSKNAPASGVWPSFVAPTVQVMLGLILFLQSRGLAYMWRRIQNSRPLAKDSS